ncbi:hypothetical protein BHE97_01200 [Aeromicrobium sp. PE09-221]|uniref:DUF6541 family protein n=1 Tax=Aeromicrobium sp. PE09-221 TaxID=1898043 RepID=UPI000B3E9D2F|nr:DUF6541 family protein [Aeromicrobium sp. PE09-221]OUZ12371.1 hypothetical protein BHE97_01200 [Aeromicrobium sp. PE09-221]
MLDWIMLGPAVIVAAALLVLPGATLAAVLGVRGFGILAAGVPISVTVVAGSAILAPWVGLRWSLVPVGLTWAALLLVAWALHRLVRRLRAFERPPAWRRRPASPWPGLVAWVLGSLYMTYLVARIPGTPSAFSIRFDNAFHLGATRYALETGNASAFHVSGFASLDGVASLYPAAWHGFLSLVVQTTGVTLPEASNALMIAVATVGWVSGCVFLGLVVSRHRILAVVAGAALACCFHTFPFLLLNYGTLYPNFLGVSLLPVMLGLTAILLRVRGVQPEVTRGTALLVLGASLPGLLLAHPNTALVWALLTVILASVSAFEWAVRSSQRGRALVTAAVVTLALVAVTAAAWSVMRPPRDESPWAPYRELPGAAWELVTNSQVFSPIPVSVSVAIIVGLVLLVLKRRFAFVAVWAVIGAMFVITVGGPDGDLRWFVSGVFFQDNLRVVALTAVSAMAPAIIGFVALARWWMAAVTWAARRLGVDSARTRGRVARVALAVIIVLGMLVAYSRAVNPALHWAREAYTITDRSYLLDADEWAMLQRLPELVPEDALLMGEPRSGTPFVYALTGIRVAPAYMYVIANESEETIRTQLNRSDANEGVRDRVCEAVDDLGGDVYVLNFQRGRYPWMYRGLNRLGPPVVEEIAREGDVTLERVTICER